MTSLRQKSLFRLHCYGFVFTPKLLPSIGFILLLPLLLYLGCWQLQRASYKKNILSQIQQRYKASPLKLSNLAQGIKKLEYYPISVVGHYDDQHQFLLDNRIYHRKAGFEVLTPFIPQLQPNKRILVNRGWVPQGTTRSELPAIKPTNKIVTINGNIKIPATHTFLLAHHKNAKTWPMIIQSINLKDIQSALNKKIYPFVLLLSPKDNSGFIRDWRPTGIKPHKHMGYAVQWFALGLTLVIIYFVLSISRGSDDRAKEDSSSEDNP